MDFFTVVTRDGKEIFVDKTENLMKSIAKYGSRAVSVMSGVSCGRISHIIAPDGKRYDQV